MSIFDGNMPYTNLHELNLDWVMKKVSEANNIVKEIKKDLPNIVSNVIKEMVENEELILVLNENYNPLTEELTLSIIGQ